MTSEDRKRIRRLRRTVRRELKKSLYKIEYDDFKKVFSFRHFWKSYRLSRRGVQWKREVARFIGTASLKIHELIQKLRKRKFKSPGFNTFWINERGKKRFIQAVAFFERVVQRCLCDWCLNPAFLPSFVRDNWASQKGKGYHDAIKRIRRKLAKFMRKHGLSGYALLYDFTDFFGSISHAIVKAFVNEKVGDKELIRLIFHFIDCFGSVGLGLGSQVSQILALSLGSKIDHRIAETECVFFHGRYMDDGIIFAESRGTLNGCLCRLEQYAAALGLKLNHKKTHIIKLSKGFTFLKKRFSFTSTHKIIMKVARKSISHQRVRLKKLIRMAGNGKLTLADIFQSWQCWKGYAGFGNSFHTVKRMESWLYRELRRHAFRIVRAAQSKGGYPNEKLPYPETQIRRRNSGVQLLAGGALYGGLLR